MPEGKDPRKHHYVSQFHIRRFADARGRVSAYDRVRGKHLRNQRPRKVLRKHDLYRAKTEDESQEFDLERLLAAGETKWSQAIVKVVKDGCVSREVIPDLVEYLAFQISRTLRQRNDMRTVSDHFSTGMAILDLRARMSANELDASERAAVEEFIEKVNNGEWKMVASESEMLRNQMSGLAQMVEVLEDSWNWIVVSLDHRGFVLTDHPIALLGDWDGTISTTLGIATAEEIWMPLDPSHALVLSQDYRQPKHIFSLSRAHARKICERLVLESSRWTIYHPGTAPLKNMNVPMQPPRMFADKFVVRGMTEETSDTLVEIGRENPQVKGEVSLSGRAFRPFPKRSHNFIDDHDP